MSIWGGLAALVFTRLAGLIARGGCVMRKDTVPPNDQRKTTDQEERKIRALEQIAASMAQISSELAQLRVMAANLNLTIARKDRADKSQTR
jgi:hypothetical protein